MPPAAGRRDRVRRLHRAGGRRQRLRRHAARAHRVAPAGWPGGGPGANIVAAFAAVRLAEPALRIRRAAAGTAAAARLLRTGGDCDGPRCRLSSCITSFAEYPNAVFAMPGCTAGAGGCFAPQNTQWSAASGRSLVQLAHFFKQSPGRSADYTLDARGGGWRGSWSRVAGRPEQVPVARSTSFRKSRCSTLAAMVSLGDVKRSAATLFGQGQHLAALRLYDAIVATAPLDYDARIRVADCALALGDPRAANVYRQTAWYCIKAGHPLAALVCARVLEAHGADPSGHRRVARRAPTAARASSSARSPRASRCRPTRCRSRCPTCGCAAPPDAVADRDRARRARDRRVQGLSRSRCTRSRSCRRCPRPRSGACSARWCCAGCRSARS